MVASAARKPKVYNPDETKYAVRPKEAHHRNRIQMLGIEESLLVPQADRRLARRPRTVAELRKWRPTQMRFKNSWPDEELADGWFEVLSLDLLLRAKNFVKRYFEFGDITTTRGKSPWLEGFSKEFISYAGMVARQDKHRGGWDAILRHKASRVPLVIGIIAKALEVNVFDQPLFGADPLQEEMLNSQDQATIESEGYSRTDLRARTVRACIGDESVTPNFWPAVDALTMQLLALLLPMLNLMDKHFVDSRANSLRTIHQDLHHIVAQAGYLAIAIRWSTTIFRFTTPLPGQQWELEQDNVDNDAYEASKTAATDANKKAAGVTTVVKPSATTAVWDNDHDENGKSDDKNDNDRAKTEDEELLFLPVLIAKVQIVQWPQLQRWAPVGGLDEDEDQGAGETVSCIMRSRVVYYAGGVSDAAEAAESAPTLAAHIRAVGRARSLRLAGTTVAMVMVVAAAVTILIVVAPGTAERMLRGMEDWARGAVDRGWELGLVAYDFVMSWLVNLWNAARNRVYDLRLPHILHEYLLGSRAIAVDVTTTVFRWKLAWTFG